MPELNWLETLKVTITGILFWGDAEPIDVDQMLIADKSLGGCKGGSTFDGVSILFPANAPLMLDATRITIIVDNNSLAFFILSFLENCYHCLMFYEDLRLPFNCKISCR
jgi:hypothetical protein